MGFRLSSFIGGMAKGFSEQIEKQEEVDTDQIQANIKSMYLGYAEQKKDVTKRKDELRGVYDFFKGVKFSDGALDNDQMIGLLSNPSLAKTVQKKIEANPEYVGKVSRNFVKAAANAPKDVDPAEWIDTIFKQASATEDQLKTLFGDKAEGNFIQRMSSTDKLAQARRAAAQLGVPLERLVGSQTTDIDTVPSMGEVDIGVFGKGPNNAKDITDKLEVDRIKAAQKFGKDSKEVADITGQINQITSLDTAVDKTNEARANRLMLAIQDTKDPAQIKDLQSQLKTTQAAIKQHKEVTSTKSASELKDVYSKMKTSVNDFVNNRMRNDSGFNWNKYYDFKTFTDPATGETITSRTQKAELKPEEQKVVFEKERQIMMSALKTNGYVLTDGSPRSVVAQEFMNNFNIRAADLASDTPTPAPATPAAVPTAQPTSNKMPAPKTQADYDAIPPGTQYMDTDGKIKRKGGK